MTAMFPLKPLALGVCLIAIPSLASASALTVYSAGPGALIEDLAADFTRETGIQVNVFQSTTGQVMARLESEQSNPLADVVISASWDSAKSLHEQDLLHPYLSPNAETVPDFLKSEHYVAQGVSALALVWNRDSDVPQPGDWSDLTDAAYRDQVTMPDPAQSGAAFELITGLLTAMGDEATWSLVEELSDNGMIVPGPNARALNPVLQGAKSVVFGAVDYISLGQQADGEAIEVIFPTSGTVIAPRPMMILASSRMPNEAERFIDFVLSEQGQARVAESYLMPARSDIEALRPTLEELALIDVDSEAMNAQRDVILQRFREVTGS
ncbi:ABC transporter substrate-binding protein [Halomonas daqingensis]|uniref:ABC transporter substrate-binding protein n=2 Tax=Billgrantia desiderata TaxID=52021 RepID=A0ABS9B3D6_9GAMM|nr:ABC transporter substrate-binding protein [Halomonas desiderata]MCE8042295.1 ABC transporter substrate-binding protein [Halomonas desiderata]MCE8046560.1 ABC transporter substrate-binding protein [Halomonas desiderata]